MTVRGQATEGGWMAAGSRARSCVKPSLSIARDALGAQKTRAATSVDAHA